MLSERESFDVLDDFRTSSGAYRRFGHRIEVVTVATPEALSQLGILDRFLTDAAAGGGRYVSWDNHDTCAKELPRTVAVIEAEDPRRCRAEGLRTHD
ncbi:zeta toxin family protein [Streptomyces mirabilis]